MISKKFLIPTLTWTGAFLGLFFLSACWDDEQQVRELVQLREKLSLVEKKAVEAVEEADTARRELSEAAASAAGKGMADRLKESQKRISDLEAQLAAAHQQPAAAEAKPAESGSSFRDHARQVQENLMKQMGVLSDSLQSRHTGPSLEEITVKKIHSGFRSEIVFGVLGGDGQKRHMAFPVEADLEGQWNLPSVDIIAKHLGASPAPNPPPQPELAQTPAPSLAAPAPAANLPASPLPVSDTIVIQWSEAPGKPAVAVAPTPPPPASAKPATAPAPTPKPPPAPIMPVTKDVQIRFD
jgi:hypothetical protein